MGIHFSLGDEGRWMDDKGKGMELFACDLRVVAALTGEPLRY